MTYTDYAAQARSYSATASAATRRAEAEAGRSATCYKTAARSRRSAAWLTRHQDVCRPWHTPATEESSAARWVRLGDIYLRSSFRETAQAAFYRELAARYRALAARQAARLAESLKWLAEREAAELAADVARFEADGAGMYAEAA